MLDLAELGRGDVPATKLDYVPICLSSLRTDQITDFDVYIQLGPSEPFILYCQRSIPFTDEARQRLIDNKVAQVFITGAQRRDYGRYVEKNLQPILTDEQIPIREKAEILYSSAYGVVEDFLMNPDHEEGVLRTKDIVWHTVDSMFTSRIHLGHILQVISADYYIYTHSVNVTAYSVALAQRVGYSDPATLRELANGALLHDIGKSRLSPDVTHCKGKLSPEQWEMLKLHPVYGHDMLRQTASLGEIALDIVLHHHEKVHGGGYPHNIGGGMISPFVRMVTIADIFDALTTERSFQRARRTFDALRLMASEVSHDIDPYLFRTFVSLLGEPGPKGPATLKAL